jgi:hypothetical protein
MSVFDTIFGYSSTDKMADYRQALVGNKRGTLISGTFADDMHLAYPDGGQQGMFGEGATTPAKLFTRTGRAQQPGLIFDKNGGEKAIDITANGGSLKLLEDFAGHLKFARIEDRDNWQSADPRIRKRCVARNIEDMVKKTEINYRTHGDRLHYLVIGLLDITDIKGESGKYPLFLFSCSEIDRGKLTADVEQTGFANFAVDRLLLQQRLHDLINGYEIEINQEFSGRLNELAAKVNKLELPEIETIKMDPEFSALSIVTGFEAEYIDPVWEKILQEGAK